MSSSENSDEDYNLQAIKSDRTKKRAAGSTIKNKSCKRSRVESLSDPSDSSSEEQFSKVSKNKTAVESDSGEEADRTKDSKRAAKKAEEAVVSKTESEGSGENPEGGSKKKELKTSEAKNGAETNEVGSDDSSIVDTVKSKELNKKNESESSKDSSDAPGEDDGKEDGTNAKNHEKAVTSSSSDSEGTLAALRADQGKPVSKSPKKKNSDRRDENVDMNTGTKRKSLPDDNSSGDNLRSESPRSTKSHDSTKTKKKSDEESSRFKRLRRLATVAGLRFRYKQLEGVKDSKKCRILKQFMTEQGITKFTLKDCKEFRIKKEEEAELAELSCNKIYGADSTRRVTRGSRKLEESSKTTGRKAHLSTSSSNNGSEREEMIEENRQIFGRLKGIVSDDSD